MTAAAEQIVYIASIKIDEFQQNFNQFTFAESSKSIRKTSILSKLKHQINKTIEIFPLNRSNILHTVPSVDEFLNFFCVWQAASTQQQLFCSLLRLSVLDYYTEYTVFSPAVCSQFSLDFQSAASVLRRAFEQPPICVSLHQHTSVLKKPFWRSQFLT